MKHGLKPTDLIENANFELLAEIDHLQIKQFIFEQIAKEKNLIKLYSAYQIGMIALFIFLFVKAMILLFEGDTHPILMMGASILFSFTLLIILHELIHAAAYRLKGAGKVQFGAIWRKFIFYAAVDQEVIDYPSFKFVAYAPLVVVKVISLVLTIAFWHSPVAYFFITLMCTHSLFCAGDMAMLAFYMLHPDKEIYNFDDLSQKKTYFYFRKKSDSFA